MGWVKDSDSGRELEIYKSMFAALPQSMFLLDKDKNIIGIYNASQEMLAGFSVDDIVGNNISVYADDPSSPFCQACSMLRDAFDPVFETGNPLKVQYKVLDADFEASITKISGGRVLGQVRDITDIVRKQSETEEKKRKELEMALLAGGLTSWTYDVPRKILSSRHFNNVIVGDTPLDDLMARIDPQDRAVTQEMFADIIDRGAKHGHITVRVLNMQGTRQWSDVHAMPYEYSPEGRVTLIIGSQKDVTREYEHDKQLKKLFRQNSLILNNTDSAFVYLTPDLKIEWENVSDVFPDPGIARFFNRGFLDSGKDGPGAVVARALCSASKFSGKYRTDLGTILEVIAQPVFGDSGEIDGVVLRVDDITRKEEAICELAQAKEAAEQSDKLKSAFLANMSHEIRTPLNAIVGFSQLIQSAENETQRQEYIDIVNSNSEILINLINDILDLSKIEAGYLSRTDAVFNLSDLFSEMEALFRYKVRPQVELRCEIPPGECLVNLDCIRVTQIVSNFMTNAVKFTTKGYIKMGYEVTPEGIRLFVQDTGCGMDADQVKRVFGRFEKLNSFAQGTGLGTSIAKAIVDAYDGQIGVDSAPGVGSTFWAVLPVSPRKIRKGQGIEDIPLSE